MVVLLVFTWLWNLTELLICIFIRPKNIGLITLVSQLASNSCTGQSVSVYTEYMFMYFGGVALEGGLEGGPGWRVWRFSFGSLLLTTSAWISRRHCPLLLHSWMYVNSSEDMKMFWLPKSKGMLVPNQSLNQLPNVVRQKSGHLAL